ncbi:hypothetical protein C8R47DRAFT_1255471, partial [Mycena vitilis]
HAKTRSRYSRKRSSPSPDALSPSDRSVHSDPRCATSPESTDTLLYEDDGHHLAYPSNRDGFAEIVPANPPILYSVGGPSVLRTSRDDSGDSIVRAALEQGPWSSRSPCRTALFDPERPQFPHPTHMSHFMQLFFQHLAAEFLFINSDELWGDFLRGALPPLLANCIATLATRYSRLAELAVEGLDTVADRYAANAKASRYRAAPGAEILDSSAHIPSMSTLHGAMLLSWFEYKNRR